MKPSLNYLSKEIVNEKRCTNCKHFMECFPHSYDLFRMDNCRSFFTDEEVETMQERMCYILWHGKDCYDSY